MLADIFLSWIYNKFGHPWRGLLTEEKLGEADCGGEGEEEYIGMEEIRVKKVDVMEVRIHGILEIKLL